MGGSGDTVLAAGSERESGVCISFRHRKNLTDCCNPADEMQIIRVTKTSPNQGIFHSSDESRVLCYESRKKRFRILRLKELSPCRKVRHKQRKRRNRVDLRGALDARERCEFSMDDIKNQSQITVGRRAYQCMLYEDQTIGYTYVSAEKGDKFLSVRNGRVQKVHKKIREKHKRLYRISLEKLKGFADSSRSCAR
ncbi:uncharacterized protein LOC122255164 isoform X2 [Penaeus japonicus]|nr:uncharacterized protein LOC122255164 isoform X2 [Penaeus japonicus]